jgi:integrase
VRAITFRSVANDYIKAHAPAWRNPKHRAQWRSTLDTYVHPVIGDMPVTDVATAHVMAVLGPIWTIKPETATRVRGRIEAVLDYAKASEWRGGENPARWRGHLDNLLPARRKVRAVKHHAALPWTEAGTFLAELRQQAGMGAKALEFAVLTAARSGEVLGARWKEIDLLAGVWTVPAARMKAGVEHRVPLSAPALALLGEVAKLRLSDSAEAFVFPSPVPTRPLSNMAMTMVLRRMHRSHLTVHGFRSCFRDWTAETTGFPREVAEAALAHTLEDKVEAAYRRGDLFDKRRALMNAWGSFCANIYVRSEGNIFVLHAG